MSSAKHNGLINTKNMSRTSTLYAGHMFKVSSQYVEICRSSSRHKILLNHDPLQKIMDWSIWKKICRANLRTNICLKFQADILKNVDIVNATDQPTNKPTNRPDDDSYIPPKLCCGGINISLQSNLMLEE
jgi:hypothetical protein